MTMAVIKVPKTPKRAYDTSRPAGDLLKRQIEHLEWAVRPASQRQPAQLPEPFTKTEGEAAKHIAILTKQLHKISDAAPDRVLPPNPVALQPMVTEKEKLGGAKRTTRAGAAKSAKKAKPAKRSMRATKARPTR
jgi:hypothetical protein